MLAKKVDRDASGNGSAAVSPAFVAALKAIGYQGCLSAEVFPLPSAFVAAHKSAQSVQSATAT